MASAVSDKCVCLVVNYVVSLLQWVHFPNIFAFLQTFLDFLLKREIIAFKPGCLWVGT